LAKRTPRVEYVKGVVEIIIFFILPTEASLKKNPEKVKDFNRVNNLREEIERYLGEDN